MSLESYARNLYGPQKFVDLSFVVIQGVLASGAVVRDAENSSPETTLTGGSGGQFSVTFPPCVFAHIVNILVCAEGEAAGVGQSVHCETMSASAGTLTFETTTETANTPVVPTDGHRIYVTLLIGNQ